MSMPPGGHPAHPGSYETYMNATGQWAAAGSGAGAAPSGLTSSGETMNPAPDPTVCPCGPGATGSCDTCGFGYCSRHGDDGLCASCASAQHCLCGEVGAFPCAECNGRYCRRHAAAWPAKWWDRDERAFMYSGGRCTYCADREASRETERARVQAEQQRALKARRSERLNSLRQDETGLVASFLRSLRVPDSELLFGTWEPYRSGKRASRRVRSKARRHDCGEFVSVHESQDGSPFVNVFRLRGWDTGVRGWTVHHVPGGTGRGDSDPRDVRSDRALWLSTDGRWHNVVLGKKYPLHMQAARSFRQLWTPMEGLRIGEFPEDAVAAFLLGP